MVLLGLPGLRVPMVAVRWHLVARRPELRWRLSRRRLLYLLVLVLAQVPVPLLESVNLLVASVAALVVSLAVYSYALAVVVVAERPVPAVLADPTVPAAVSAS